MRVGTNPNRIATIRDEIKDIAVTVVTHLPNLTTGYHSKRVEVVKACLTTMREGAHVDHTFMVWDNGSIPELRNWLQDEFKPDVLVLSKNIGKTSARSSLARMCKPGSIFCYSDDDMLFYDGWLEAQIEILEHFPNVACVTGYPVRTAFRWGVENTLKWAKIHGDVRFGKLIPQEWDDDFAVSVGRTPEFQREYTKNDIDYQVTYKGKTAYCTSHHCQFIGYIDRILPLMNFDSKALADEKPFDIAMDKIGLRLATTERFTKHIGNVIDDKIRSELWQAI